MKNLTVTLGAAVAEYSKASEEGKAILEKLFGKKELALNITERVKTFDDACGLLGISSSVSETRDEIAYKQLKVIAEALNEGWTPNWDDEDEYKYFPWFRCGSGFSFSHVLSRCTFSGLGSRLCFRSRELAEYAGNQFLSIYKDFLS